MSSIDLVWESYQVTVDSMKVTRRAIDQGPANLVVGTNIGELSTSVASQKLKSAQSDLNDLFILALWSVFERELRDHLAAEGPRPLDNSTSPFHHRFATRIRETVEYWKNDDVLDLFKAIVAPDSIGRAKQIREYRDWVAHRNPKLSRPVNITPKVAYSTLSEIVDSLPGTANPAVAPGLPTP